MAQDSLYAIKLKWWNWKDKDKSGIKNHSCKYSKSNIKVI